MAKRGRRRRNLTPEIAENESRLLRSEQWATAASRIGVEVVRWAGIGYVAYRFSLPFIAWSGETTIANVAVSVGGTGMSGAAAGLGFLVGVAGLTYGRLEAWLRRKTIREFAVRVRELETALDAHRSSSGLTESGDTPPAEEAQP